MSTFTKPVHDQPDLPVTERIEELREIEEELRIVANSETPYAPYAQRYLDALEAADD